MKIQNILESFVSKFQLVSTQTYHIDSNRVDGSVTIIDQNNGVKYSFDVSFTNKSFNIEDVEVDDHGEYHEGDAQDNRVLANYIRSNYKEILTAFKENQ